MLNYSIKIIQRIILFAFILLLTFNMAGILDELGRVLGDKQAIVQYGLAGIIVICALAFYIWLRRKYR